jgi:hypothetical protein
MEWGVCQEAFDAAMQLEAGPRAGPEGSNEFSENNMRNRELSAKDKVVARTVLRSHAFPISWKALLCGTVPAAVAVLATTFAPIISPVLTEAKAVTGTVFRSHAFPNRLNRSRCRAKPGYLRPSTARAVASSVMRPLISRPRSAAMMPGNFNLPLAPAITRH